MILYPPICKSRLVLLYISKNSSELSLTPFILTEPIHIISEMNTSPGVTVSALQRGLRQVEKSGIGYVPPAISWGLSFKSFIFIGTLGEIRSGLMGLDQMLESDLYRSSERSALVMASK